MNLKGLRAVQIPLSESFDFDQDSFSTLDAQTMDTIHGTLG